MATMTIKELYKEIIPSDNMYPFLFADDWYYPEGATNSFLDEYTTNFALYDRYFIKEHGAKTIDLDDDFGDPDDISMSWFWEMAAIYNVYVEAWAKIYDTLNIAYNPVYNVEEHIVTEYGEHETEHEYGEHETETEYGQHETDMQYGATSDTLGSHTDTATEYSVSFDGATEKETGKTSNVVGSQTNTSLLHTDTETSKLHTDTTTSKLHTDTDTSKLHTDTVDRTGNIGIKSSTALATEEIFMREKQIFFKNIFLTISRELGAYYGIND